MDIVQQLAAIVFVFALLGTAVVWLRRKNLILLGRPRTITPAKRLQVVDRVRLTPQHSVHVLRAGEREYIIAAHAAGCTLLASNPVEQPDTAGAGGSQK